LTRKKYDDNIPKQTLEIEAKTWFLKRFPVLDAESDTEFGKKGHRISTY